MFMHRSPISFDDDWIVVTIIDILVIVCIFQSNIFFLETGRAAADSALIPGVEGQTEHILLVDEENDHHPSLRVDGAFDGRAPAIVGIRIDMWVRIRTMKGQRDHLALLKVFLSIARELAYCCVDSASRRRKASLAPVRFCRPPWSCDLRSSWTLRRVIGCCATIVGVRNVRLRHSGVQIAHGRTSCAKVRLPRSHLGWYPRCHCRMLRVSIPGGIGSGTNVLHSCA